MAVIAPGGNESIYVYDGIDLEEVPFAVAFEEELEHSFQPLDDGNLINAGYKYVVQMDIADLGTLSSGVLNNIEQRMFNKGKDPDFKFYRTTKGDGLTAIYDGVSVFAFYIAENGTGRNTTLVIKFACVRIRRVDITLGDTPVDDLLALQSLGTIDILLQEDSSGGVII